MHKLEKDICHETFRAHVPFGSPFAPWPALAQAQRKSPLADAPAIRKRVELRSTRLEVGAGAGSTLNQDFYHTMFVNLKLGFHITDWLSLSAFGAFTVASLETGFQDRVRETLPDANPVDPREPTAQKAVGLDEQDHADAGRAARVHALHGQVLAVRQAVRALRLLRLRGPGALNLADRRAPRTARLQAPGRPFRRSSGFKPGGNAGVGVHSFINQFLALNFELRDIVARINPSGRDVNGDGVANDSDLSWGSTFMVTPNLVSTCRRPPTSRSSREVGVPSPKKKVTLYFSATMLEETQREAIRQDRSISWIIQAAWRMSRDEVRRLPGVCGVAPGRRPARRCSPPSVLRRGVKSPRSRLRLEGRTGRRGRACGALDELEADTHRR